MKWDFKKLNKLSKTKKLPDSKVYQKALVWKREIVLFHSEQSTIVWDKLFCAHQKLIVGDKKWWDTHIASEAHIIAAAQALHSMADIIGQIINQVLLCGALPENKVTLYNVLCELNKKAIAPNILTKVTKFKNSTEFEYIDAFVNITKHRRVLDTNSHAEYGPDKRNNQGILFKNFIYRNKKFPTTWAKDIVGPYRAKIFKDICDIGNSINSYISI